MTNVTIRIELYVSFEKKIELALLSVASAEEVVYFGKYGVGDLHIEYAGEKFTVERQDIGHVLNALFLELIAPVCWQQRFKRSFLLERRILVTEPVDERTFLLGDSFYNYDMMKERNPYSQKLLLPIKTFLPQIYRQIIQYDQLMTDLYQVNYDFIKNDFSQAEKAMRSIHCEL